MKEKIFIHYLERNDKTGENVDVTGWFELIEEGKNFLVINTGKNEIRIPYHRIIKLKKEVKNKK